MIDNSYNHIIISKMRAYWGQRYRNASNKHMWDSMNEAADRGCYDSIAYLIGNGKVPSEHLGIIDQGMRWALYKYCRTQNRIDNYEKAPVVLEGETSSSVLEMCVIERVTPYDSLLGKELVQGFEGVRRAILGHRLEGLEYEEIGELLGMTKQAVHYHIKKIRGIIEKRL